MFALPNDPVTASAIPPLMGPSCPRGSLFAERRVDFQRLAGGLGRVLFVRLGSRGKHVGSRLAGVLKHRLRVLRALAQHLGNLVC